ncbi:MAG: PspA/IM30 family protein [Gammaproteobacteria bacterium]
MTTENIASRVTRIVSGGVHALLDAVEQAVPETAMVQAIREVEQVVDEVRAELGRVLARKHVANSNLAQLRARHEELTGHIEIAVEKGEDDLCRAGIAKQLDLEAQIPIVEKAIVEAGEEEKELEGYLLALQAKKRDMEEALNQLVAARADNDKPSPIQPGETPAQRAERAAAAFDRLWARQSGFSGTGPVDSAEAASKLKELAELTRSHRIEERLAACKAKLSR